MRNGSIVNDLAHKYIHWLPREDEEEINNMLREYKACKVEFAEDLEFDCSIKSAIVQFGKNRNRERDKDDDMER